MLDPYIKEGFKLMRKGAVLTYSKFLKGFFFAIIVNLSPQQWHGNQSNIFRDSEYLCVFIEHYQLASVLKKWSDDIKSS